MRMRTDRLVEGLTLPGALWVLAATAWWSPTVVEAQSPPVNASLVGHWDGYAGDHADVWADGDYAYVGIFTLGDGALARVHIIDISNGANPTLAQTYNLTATNQFRSPQDVKVANGLLFIGLEAGGSDLVEIVDVRDPLNPAYVTSLRQTGFNNCHNTFYDNGFLYVVDSNTPRVAIFDLRTLDPDNPPAGPITSALWVINDVGSVFVHDVTVRNNRLYCAAWDSGLQVYDVTDVANSIPSLLGGVGGNNTHSMWPTDDGEFVITGEERSNGGITVYRITDNGITYDLTQTDSLVLSSDAFSVHNQVVVGNRVFISWYQAGLQVFDINSVTGALEFVASYDTSTFANNGGFAGAWGVYPFLGLDKVLVSDLEEGLFVIDVQEPLLQIAYPDGLPALADPNGGTEIRVEVVGEGGTPDTSGGTLFYRSGGGLFSSVPMTFDGTYFVGAVGTSDCGETVDYYFTFETVEGDTVFEPNDAPTGFYSALSAVDLIDSVSIDFEIDPGWAVTGSAVDGQWDRGVPIGNCDRGNPLVDFDGSGSCFLTDNSDNGGNCNSDVDDGTTTLTTSVFDMTGLSMPHVGYARWFNNSAGAAPNEDLFVVEVSNNGGSTWTTLETVGPSGPGTDGGWFDTLIDVSSAIAVTDSMVFRFNANDTGNGSVVEAGIDAFRLVELDCTAEDAPAQVTQQPQAETVCENDTATFSVSASGAPPITYQWRVDTIDIPGANSSTLMIANATAGDEGQYSCEVTNAFGSDVSGDAELAVVTPASCDDGNACTADSCSAGSCENLDDTPGGQCCDPVSGGLTAIDDGDACTDDVCGGDGSVSHDPNYDVGTQCCAPADGQTTLIDDADACTDDTCNPDGTVLHADNYDGGTDCCDPADGSLTTIDDGDDCTNDVCDAGTGEVAHTAPVPDAASAGGRTVSVTPDQACTDVVAILVTSPDYPCLSAYVDTDGTLTAAPVFQTPAQWSTVQVSAEEIVPGSTYTFAEETMGGVVSTVSSSTTWLWGDVNNNGAANFEDVQLIVLAFQGDFNLVTLEAADLDPCMPNGVINFGDIQRGVNAFQGFTYSDGMCPIPCE